VRMVLLVSLHVIIDAQISPIQSRRTSCRHPGAGASCVEIRGYYLRSSPSHTKCSADTRLTIPCCSTQGAGGGRARQPRGHHLPGCLYDGGAPAGSLS
jgi:hypothetical protein